MDMNLGRWLEKTPYKVKYKTRCKICEKQGKLRGMGAKATEVLKVSIVK